MTMRGAATGIAIATAALCAAPGPAHAVVKGSPAQSLTNYTVRLVGNGTCSGVVIARQLVATARHCAYGMSVVAAHRYFRVTKVSRIGTLDDGRRVIATGDSSFLHLSRPLPETVAAVPVGDGEGERYIIAGYSGGSRLRQASLVAESEHALVDPAREGSISASACFGDSGGPVIRGGWLVGVITRAAHPSPRRACGYLTRWAPIRIATDTEIEAAAEKREAAEQARKQRKRTRHVRRAHHKRTASSGWTWFNQAPQARR